MTPLQILIAGRELISDPRRWTQELFARNSRETKTGALANDAVCWCSLGALIKVSEDYPNHSNKIQRFKAKGFLKEAIDHQLVHDFNDTHSHAEVLQMWDRAIALAREEEGVK